MAACGKKQEITNETATKKQTSTYQIGICLFHSDSYSKEMSQGFQDALNMKLKSDQINFSLKEANGDAAAFSDACAELDSANSNLIFLENQGLTTSIDTNAYKTKIFTMPDLPITEQAEDTLLQLLPDMSLVGILYDSTDSSSLSRTEELKKNLETDGIRYKEYAATDNNSLKENVNHICDECDSLYIVSGDLMTENIDTLSDSLIPAGIPAIADSEKLCQTGIASVSAPAYVYNNQ